MRILIVNDDGINAEGIKAMARALALTHEHEIFVVAPHTQQSGMAQALTMGVALKVKNETILPDDLPVKAYSVEGTPADCTKLALEILLKDIDLVISGINDGTNLGTDVLYSGTVGAALEAYVHNIPSLAVSVGTKSTISFDQIAQVIADNLNYLCRTGKLFMYNINFPNKLKDDKVKFVFTKQGYRFYKNEFDIVNMPDGSVAYRMQGRAQDLNNDEQSDIVAFNKGYVSITPLCLERTDFVQLNQLKDLN